VAESVRYLVGARLTAAAVAELAHRLAGNRQRLRERRPVAPWAAQRWPEWVPVQILAVRRARDARDRDDGASLSFKIMAGTPCPIAVPQWWSLQRCRFLSRTFGFSRPMRRVSGMPPKYPYSVPEQLVNLRVEMLVDPEKSVREPYLDATRIVPSLAEWNREVLRRRFRVDPGYECPEGYPHDLPCHRCHVGYLRCPAATHRLDYERAPCPQCGRADAWWDPESRSGVCVRCTIKAAGRRRSR
jgi:hypothetical protein